MYCIAFSSIELNYWLPQSIGFWLYNLFSVEIYLVFLKYFFQAQFATPKKINEEIMIRRAIRPPERSETHTAHIESNVSG
jgi:hypothetical protein